MFVQEFEEIVNRLRYNDTITHSLRIIFAVITGEMLVTQENFEQWFKRAIQEMGLVEDLHYRYRRTGDIDSVFVRGTVGLNMLLRAQNNLGVYARTRCGQNQVPMRQS